MNSKPSVKKTPLLENQTLTVVIHTKNEEKMIVDCINSIKKIADEIIVADMNSTDNTVKLAKKLGAKIIKVPEYGFADPARNLALSKVTKNWVLVLDADERISPKLGKTIKKLIEKNTYDVISFPIKNIILGKWIKHGLRWPDYQNRLFRKGFAHWSDAVHEKAIYKGKLHRLEPTESNAFIHYNFSSIDQLMEKTFRYASNERYYDNKKDLTVNDIYKRMEGEFSWRFHEHNGYKDRTHGLIVNKFMQVYRFLELALYWERTEKPELASLNELKTLWSNEEKLNKITKELDIIKDSKFYIFYKTYLRIKKFIR